MDSNDAIEAAPVFSIGVEIAPANQSDSLPNNNGTLQPKSGSCSGTTAPGW
jgi:hypothetical protein